MGNWGGYFKQGFKLWGRLFGVNLLTGFLLLGLALLLLVPALIGYVYVLFACEAAILLNLSGGAAIRESYRVINGHWWATVGYVFRILLDCGWIDRSACGVNGNRKWNC